MTNEDVILSLKKVSAQERVQTARAVELIAICLKRKLWAGSAYPTAFAWLVGEFKYSESSASRRLSAARLLVSDSDLARKIESGDVSLSSAAKVQSVIYREEKRTQRKISDDLKLNLLNEIQNQSSAQTDRILAEKFPESHQAPKESIQAIRENMFSLTSNMTEEQKVRFERVREVMSHSHFGARNADIVDALAQFFLKYNDPLLREERRSKRKQKPAQKVTIKPSSEVKPDLSSQIDHDATSCAAKEVPLKQSTKDHVIAKAEGKCQYQDPKTQKTCGSRNLPQVDHIFPLALGGTNAISNLRCLCFYHNQQMAQLELGNAWANHWQTSSEAHSRLDE